MRIYGTERRISSDKSGRINPYNPLIRRDGSSSGWMYRSCGEGMGTLLAEEAPRGSFFLLSLFICSDVVMVQAVKFGRGYLDLYNPNDFVDMGRSLKVLNAVRSWEVGIPISYAQ